MPRAAPSPPAPRSPSSPSTRRSGDRRRPAHRSPACDAQDANVPVGRLGKLDFTFTATPTGALERPGTRTALTSDGEATGVVLADRAWRGSSATGSRFTLARHRPEDGRRFRDVEAQPSSGRTRLHRPPRPARILGQRRGACCLISPGSAGSRSARSGAGRRSRPISTRRRASATTPRRSTAGAERLATGTAALDRLLAGNLTLAGRVNALARRPTCERSARRRPHAAFTADGSLGRQQSDLKLALALPDLQRADPRLSGRGDVRLRNHRPAEQARRRRPQSAVANATALGRPIPRLTIDAIAKDLQGALDARVTLNGDVDSQASDRNDPAGAPAAIPTAGPCSRSISRSARSG